MDIDSPTSKKVWTRKETSTERKRRAPKAREEVGLESVEVLWASHNNEIINLL